MYRNQAEKRLFIFAHCTGYGQDQVRRLDKQRHLLCALYIILFEVWLIGSQTAAVRGVCRLCSASVCVCLCVC